MDIRYIDSDDAFGVAIDVRDVHPLKVFSPMAITMSVAGGPELQEAMLTNGRTGTAVELQVCVMRPYLPRRVLWFQSGRRCPMRVWVVGTPRFMQFALCIPWTDGSDL
jgi:hypothetical protein